MRIKKSIKVKTAVPANELIIQAKQAAEKHGLRFIGDTEKGFIEGLGIEAHYLFEEDELMVKILRKPMLLSWTLLEQKLIALVSLNQNIDRC
ncbi:MAG: hypothetical protein ACU84H_02195 [Gammaproteobacteria bacterium]